MKKKLQIIGTIAGMVFSCSMNAQSLPTKADGTLEGQPEICGTKTPGPEWDAWFNQQVENFKKEQSSGRAQVVNYTIPVIVHIVHGGQAVGTFPNLSAAQVASQIKALNDDYSAQGYNVGNVPSAFSGLVANTGIQFCLATKDKDGQTLAEPGIDRVNFNTVGVANPTSISSSTFTNWIDKTLKPKTIWDVTKYLNMWITDRPSASGLLGYATFPAGAGLSGLTTGLGTPTDDGFWCYAKCFGTTGNLLSGYGHGRVCDHEIGHYLGLRHVWGDSNCGTDYCNDTPPQQQANYNCPTYPYNKGTCSGNTTGEMTMNMMDYTSDDCKYMFTPDQVARIQTAMSAGTYRKALGTHGLCSTSSAPSVVFKADQTSGCAGITVNFTDQSTNAPTAWKWTFAGGTPASSTQQNPSIVYNASGTYSVKLVATNASGKDSVTKTSFITIQVTMSNPTVSGGQRCGSGIVNLSATGSGGILKWYNAASAGSLVNTGTSYSPNLSQTTTFYVEQTGTAGAVQKVGPADSTIGAGDYFTANSIRRMYFNVSVPVTLTSVKVYAHTTGIRQIRIIDSTGATVQVVTTPSLNVGPNKVNMGVNLPAGRNYAIKLDSSATAKLDLFRNSSGANYPYTIANLVSLTNSDAPTSSGSYYYYFYDWEVQAQSTSCPSSRVAVVGTVNTCTGVDDGTIDHSISIYPNPNNGQFTLALNLNSNEVYTLEIKNVIGQIVYKEALPNNNTAYSKEFDFSVYGKGIYLLTLNNSSQQGIRKVIVY